MADQERANQIEEKIRQALKKLGEALDNWLGKNRLRPRHIPVPIDRPHRKR